MTTLGRRLWPQLDAAGMVIQGGNDIATTPETAQRVYDHIKNGNKEMVYYADGGHELMRPVSPLHQEVWARIYDFIQTHAETPLPAPCATGRFRRHRRRTAIAAGNPAPRVPKRALNRIQSRSQSKAWTCLSTCRGDHSRPRSRHGENHG